MKGLFRSLPWMMALTSIVIPSVSHADTFSLNNLSANDFNVLVKEFSANTAYTSVTPASSLGGWGGFEIGVLGGLTKSPDTQGLVSRAGGGADFKNLYNAGLLARIGLPYAITIEGSFFPKTKISSIKYGAWGIAAMWTLNDEVLTSLPLNVAVKTSYAKNNIRYTQAVTSGTANVTFDDSVFGVMALASYKVLVFEPYVGFGYVSGNGTLTVDANLSATYFNTTYFASGTTSASYKPSGAQFLAGLDIRLGFFTLGAEYSSAFGKNRGTARVGVRF